MKAATKSAAAWKYFTVRKKAEERFNDDSRKAEVDSQAE